MSGYILLAGSPPTTVIGGQFGPSGTEATTAEVATATTGAAADAPVGLFGGLGWQWIVVYVVIFGGYIWWMMRKNKMKQKEVEVMREGLKVGDDVCTTGGLIGKIVDIDEHTFIIEFGTNKGIRIPVIKSEVVAAPTMEAQSD